MFYSPLLTPPLRNASHRWTGRRNGGPASSSIVIPFLVVDVGAILLDAFDWTMLEGTLAP